MQDLRSLVTTPAAPPRVYRGLIGDDATGPNDQVTVRVPAYDASRSFGPCYVTPRPLRSGALLYPVRNDPCVVALDENEQAEILVWWANDPTADANAASRLTSAESRLTSAETRLTNQESGVKGAGRWADLSGGNAAGTGWTWSNTGFSYDPAYFLRGTPPGGGKSANSGVKILQSGVYRARASVLCQGLGTTAGRLDAYLDVLDSAGAVLFTLDESLQNYPAGGSGFQKFNLEFEYPLLVNQWVFPVNVSAATYGDVGGGWSHLTIRYMGTL
jgi:hypothetical protein